MIKALKAAVPFTMKLQAHYFEQVCLGRKCVEGRPCRPEYQKLAVGTLIRFLKVEDLNQSVDVRITHLKKYSSFRSYLEQEGLENCLPGVRSIEEGIKMYHGFPDYVGQEASFGVLAIGIKVDMASKNIQGGR